MIIYSSIAYVLIRYLLRCNLQWKKLKKHRPIIRSGYFFTVDTQRVQYTTNNSLEVARLYLQWYIYMNCDLLFNSIISCCVVLQHLNHILISTSRLSVCYIQVFNLHTSRLMLFQAAATGLTNPWGALRSIQVWRSGRRRRASVWKFNWVYHK